MLYKKQGMPDEDEIVLCTVTAVHHHSVFAKLDDYGKTGMIHISEVSPGRIRKNNITFHRSTTLWRHLRQILLHAGQDP